MLWRYFPDFLPIGDSLNIPIDLITQLQMECNAEQWFAYAFSERSKRRHVCLACKFLARVLPPKATIFEPGCGAAANLIWLAKQGFITKGADLALPAITMAKKLTAYLDLAIELIQDDGLNPQHLPQEAVDAILSVNWLYHLNNTSLEGFLETYKNILKPNGYIATDFPDISYNKQPNNQYHTEDWHLEEDLRRPSEYKIRLSLEEAKIIASSCGFAVRRSSRTILSGQPHRLILLLQRLD